MKINGQCINGNGSGQVPISLNIKSSTWKVILFHFTMSQIGQMSQVSPGISVLTYPVYVYYIYCESGCSFFKNYLKYSQNIFSGLIKG